MAKLRPDEQYPDFWQDDIDKRKREDTWIIVVTGALIISVIAGFIYLFAQY